MPALPEYEVFALRYATREARRPENFLGGDPHDAPMPMDYFVWAIRDRAEGRVFVVDTGFEASDAAARKRTLLRNAGEALAAIGIAAETAPEVIVTHLHYDHIGGFAQFPAARFHLQDKEMAFATGRRMAAPALAYGFTADHVAAMVHRVFAGRVAFHDGDAELAPGLSLHFIGGHTMGLQVVRVRTRIGWIVLASDAAHYYETYETRRPYPIIYHVGDMLDGFERLKALADDPAFIVPGHDPQVCRRYPALEGLAGIAHRLDVEPKA